MEKITIQEADEVLKMKNEKIGSMILTHYYENDIREAGTISLKLLNGNNCVLIIPCFF